MFQEIIDSSAGLNVAGCDSTAWLHAIIEDSNTGSSSDTACDSILGMG